MYNKKAIYLAKRATKTCLNGSTGVHRIRVGNQDLFLKNGEDFRLLVY